MLRSGKIRGNLDLDSSGPPERAKTAHPVENSILLQFLLAHTLLPFLLQVDKSPYVSTYLPYPHHHSPISRSHYTTITNISCDRPLYHHHKHWVNVYSCVAQNELSPFIILLKFDALRCPWFSSFAFGRQFFFGHNCAVYPSIAPRPTERVAGGQKELGSRSITPR